MRAGRPRSQGGCRPDGVVGGVGGGLGLQMQSQAARIPLRRASMKRAITYLLLILFVGSQAGDVVRLCTEWLCPQRQNPGCCHRSQSVKSGPRATAEAGHCSLEEAASPLALNRALCCESPSDAAKSLVRTAERFPKDAFRQLLLSSAKPSGQPSSPAGSSSADGAPPPFLQDPSPPDLLSTVLRI